MAAAARRSTRPSLLSRRDLALLGALVFPLALLWWLLDSPQQNATIEVPLEHVVLVTNVALLALFTALLVARGALAARQYRIVLTALGFMSLAGIFLVHGLMTPGVLVKDPHLRHAGAIAGASSLLAVFAPALLFAARHTALAAWLERLVPPAWLIAAVVAALAAYVGATLGWTREIGELVGGLSGAYAGDAPKVDPYGRPLADPYGSAYQYGGAPPIVAAAALVLLAFAAWRQWGEYGATRLPMQGALAVSYLLLGEAQIAMATAPAWTLSWWEYHLLMLAAVVVALVALFLELDRRRGLERFLPAPVVDRVLGGDRLAIGGERQVVTVLFADLRGSTALAERLPAERVVGIVNAYLGVLARCVIANGGILDKFLGDGLMAIFGADRAPAAGARAAASAALAMRERVAALNGERAARGEPTLRFGVGINTGEVILGAMGLPERSDYTAIGDVVNTASRLEGLCKRLDVDVVLSGETARYLRDGMSVHPLGEQTVPGKSEPVEVLTLA